MVRRALRLSPMQRVCKELERRGVRLSELRALELFGSDGDRHLKDYAASVASLEIWEIDPAYEAVLRRRFPGATLRIVDSYEQIKKTPATYDFISADAYAERIYGGHCEHFDLFPNLFRIASPSAVIVLNVLPRFDDELRTRWSFVFDKDDVGAHLSCRRSFYRTSRPECITFEEMIGVYEDLARSNGFELEWHFFQKRHYAYYLVFKVRRSRAQP